MRPKCGPLKLINDVKTRWNSTYFMFERFISVREPLTCELTVLGNELELPSTAEFVVLDEVTRILKPFQQVTEELSAEKNVSASNVIVMIKDLMRALTARNLSNSNTAALSATAKKLGENFLQNLRSRLTSM